MEKVVTQPPNPYPWLVFVHDGEGESEKFKGQIFCDVVSATRTTFARSIPGDELRNREFVRLTNQASWLLFKSDESESESSIQLCLWNPITSQSFYLPSLELEKSSVKYINFAFLTKPAPTDPDCVLLLFVDHSRSIIFCNTNDQTWTISCYKEQIAEIDAGDVFRDPISCENDTSILVSTLTRGCIAKIEIVKPATLVITPFCLVRRLWPQVPGLNHRLKLIKFPRVLGFCGDIFMMQFAFGGVGHEEVISVAIFKLDLSSEAWNVVDSCPNAAFFLGGDDAQPPLSCPISSADSSAAGNRIYFAAEGNRLYTYHIQHKTLQVSLLPRRPAAVSATVPHWILIPDDDAQELAKAEQDYHAAKYGQEDEIKGTVFEKINHVEEKATAMLLDDIPVDILRMIASHLINPIDYLNFRSANKRCCSIGSAKEWSGSRSCAAFPSPWLMIPSLDRGVICMLDPITHHKYYITTPENWKKEDTRICYSRNGWLLICSEFDSEELVRQHLELYNPLTKSTLCLPDTPFRMDHFFITSPPAESPHPVVAGLSFELGENMYCETYPGTTEWYLVDYITPEPGLESYNPQQSHVYPVFENGGFFFLGRDNVGVVFQCEHKFFVLVVHPVKELCTSFEHSFLTKCDINGDGEDSIISVYIGKDWEWLRVFRLHINEDKEGLFWKEVNDLDNNNLYLSTLSSVTMKAESPAMGNRIYFPRFVEDSIVYYSLRTSRFHLSNGNNSSDDPLMISFDGSKEQLYSCWFQPSYD